MPSAQTTEETEVDTFLVTLADRDTGQDQRVLVRADDASGMQEYIDSRPRGTKGEQITLTHPVVIGVRKLHIKRPPFKTNMAQLAKSH